MSEIRKELNHRKMIRTAGEVRFIKDHGDDSNAWAWGQHPPSERVMDRNHSYNKKCVKNLSKVLKSTLMSLGHAMSAYTVFAKMKSRDISPDGNLGGRGYIMEIKAIRRQYMNVVEALSAMSDTIYDEITADHWAEAQGRLVQQVLDEVEEIKDDPEAWAETQEDMSSLVDKVHEKKEIERSKTKPEDLKPERDFSSSRGKTANLLTPASRVAQKYMREMI
tara:strand:- start:1121 stop:1783 length:663 start_codon:yes stop_codon:yes gene_type:complete